MEEFNKNIEGIRRMMADLRDEKYAFVNPALASLEEYEKTLYLKTLCSLVQFGAPPSETQLLLLKRIINGMDVEDTVEEYMRRALEITETDMQEFLTVMEENEAKYYFALDGLLLTAIEREAGERYQYLAEIIELLDICKDDLQYICLVASAVLQQQSSLYDEAKALENERLQPIDYSPYLQSFYCGAIKDSRELVHYCAPDRKDSDSIAFRRLYTEKRVVIENLNINVSDNWYFENCEEVVLINCNFTGKNSSIGIKGCQAVYISRCRFADFRVPVLEQEHNMEVIIEECEFENCIDENQSPSFFDDMGGSIIHCYDSLENAVNVIRGTEFRNCGVQLNDYQRIEGVIANCGCEVSDCSFYHCHHLYKKNEIANFTNSTLFLKGTANSNNELINSLAFC